MNLLALRSHNAAAVLSLLRAAPDGMTRLELAERTGLTPQAVSKITARLRAEGLVDEAGRTASTGGKPRTLLRLARHARYAAGAYLDRDELTVVLADLAGGIVDIRTSPPGDTDVLEALAGAVRAVATGAVLGVGVAAPGPLGHESGVLGRVTGFPQWEGMPLRAALTAALGLPVVLDKDTNAAALAVRGTTRDSFAYLHLGTGLGAGLVLDGALHRGRRTGAGEFGHQAVRLDGPLCVCGNHGCLEALCLEAVRAGDPAGAARLLGVGAANLVALLDIDRVVLGGRTVLADPALFVHEVAAVVRQRTGRPLPVSAAPGGSRTVAEGAAALVLGRFFGGGKDGGEGSALR
ncbi:ROK family protein [Actinacidiphila oryziradicis]|uniref:ROK family protein n=1 Tax=Actinacidiphila oryziradicis TaxID=2571141 RepID=A0A4U0STM4_9ACTN|nr:ROK family protein [Actinacidiphila oryziradicis]TKA13432.1 ROK family protein [Actinacidiphila oryziradicis]